MHFYYNFNTHNLWFVVFLLSRCQIRFYYQRLPERLVVHEGFLSSLGLLLGLKLKKFGNSCSESVFYIKRLEWVEAFYSHLEITLFFYPTSSPPRRPIPRPTTFAACLRGKSTTLRQCRWSSWSSSAPLGCILCPTWRWSFPFWWYCWYPSGKRTGVDFYIEIIFTEVF